MSPSERAHAHAGNAEKLELFLPPEEIDELTSNARRDFTDDLRRGWHVRVGLALERQTKVAKLMRELKPLHSEALGQLTLVVDPVLYEEAKRMYGPECWRDKDFRDAVARDTPEMAIRSKSRGTTILRP